MFYRFSRGYHTLKQSLIHFKNLPGTIEEIIKSRDVKKRGKSEQGEVK